MTEELKTLKDLCSNLRVEHEDGSIEDEPCDGVVRESELRQEAIKWIKMGRTDCKQTNYLLSEQTQPEEWIKHFFNITESDLK